jgi:2-keto-3-deoxy-6-phosphogluconate aldolase
VLDVDACRRCTDAGARFVVSPADAGAYLRAGARAVCLSEALVDRAAVAAGDIEAVARHARAVMADITEGDSHGQHR